MAWNTRKPIWRPGHILTRWRAYNAPKTHSWTSSEELRGERLGEGNGGKEEGKEGAKGRIAPKMVS